MLKPVTIEAITPAINEAAQILDSIYMHTLGFEPTRFMGKVYRVFTEDCTQEVSTAMAMLLQLYDIEWSENIVIDSVSYLEWNLYFTPEYICARYEMAQRQLIQDQDIPVQFVCIDGDYVPTDITRIDLMTGKLC